MSYRPDSFVTYIVEHYTATPIEREYTYEQLEADHLKRGFREGGYHIYITRDRPGKPARVIYGRDLSQPGRFEMGAHSSGENDQSIGICYEGGVTLAEPNIGRNTMTPAQEKLMVAEIKKLMKRFPNAVLKGHRDMPGAATQCPGFDVGPWWDRMTAIKPRQSIFTLIADAFRIWKESRA
ncbi:MAG: N-acetylmuramoyl-L-alanine amidase [Pseudomonadota bacterium]